MKKKKIHFFLILFRSTKIKNEKEIFVSLEGIGSKRGSAVSDKKRSMVELKMILKNLRQSAAPISFLGFTIVSDKEELGEVTEVIEQPHQVLCEIIIEGKEVLIPIHEDSLRKGG